MSQQHAAEDMEYADGEHEARLLQRSSHANVQAAVAAPLAVAFPLLGLVRLPFGLLV
jgi:hypothetical protein